MRRLIPKWLLSGYHLAWAYFAAMRYGFPSRRMTIIGVTGTNGKSSVVWLLTRMLEEGGLKTASSSSMEFQIGDRCIENRYKMTMPGRGRLQKFLAEALEAGCTHVVIEVTSEGIAQHRHQFIDFDIAVFLNLSPEHIERHGGYENYRAAKEELFRNVMQSYRKGQQQKVIVANVADKESPHFLQYPADRHIGFRTEHQTRMAALRKDSLEAVAEQVRLSPHGVRFTYGGARFTSSLRGATNVENLLASAIVAQEVGVAPEDAARAAKAFSDIPGRLERIKNTRGLTIVVDYAHTPTALERVYETLHGDGRRMICVLGAAGGGRDVWKRPKLGALAGRYCTLAIVADEDPYDENPAVIREAVLRGAAQGGRAKTLDIADRREAIRYALTEAKSGDSVIITGKGSEPWMVLAGGEKIPWDDRAVVRKALEES